MRNRTREGHRLARDAARRAAAMIATLDAALQAPIAPMTRLGSDAAVDTRPTARRIRALEREHEALARQVQRLQEWREHEARLASAWQRCADAVPPHGGPPAIPAGAEARVCADCADLLTREIDECTRTLQELRAAIDALRRRATS